MAKAARGPEDGWYSTSVARPGDARDGARADPAGDGGRWRGRSTAQELRGLLAGHGSKDARAWRVDPAVEAPLHIADAPGVLDAWESALAREPPRMLGIRTAAAGARALGKSPVVRRKKDAV